ncbi:hypothetical protein JL720_3176 [Aureococcus anophagefferens]|nr:hypothetical protein JL720_3176 [Aureococcus anophagefferens]
MGLGLEALGISADDMTPAEAAELSRLLKQQKGGGAIPALITSASAKEAAAADAEPGQATTLPAYPSVRIGQSARAYAERQRLARAGEAQRAEHGDGDDFGGKRGAARAEAARRRHARGPLARPRYPPAPPPRRKRHGGGGRGRGGGPAPADDGDADGRDGQSNLEIAGFSVQVARTRGALYMDTLHSTVAKRSIEKTAPHVAQRPLGTSDLVEGLMGWLTHLGMPVDACGAEQLSEYEADALASYKRVEEAEVGHLVALLIGTAANDVTFGALVSALKVAAAPRRNAADAADGGDSLASDDLDRENIAGFGASAYRDLKRHVVQAAHARGARAFAQHKPLEQQTIMRIATLVDDHGIDLQEVFLDTPVRVGVVRGDVRISFAELRRGLWRLLSCLPPA